MVVSVTALWFLRQRLKSETLFGDVELQTDPESGREMLVWIPERGSKTRHGLEGAQLRAVQPQRFCKGNGERPNPVVQLRHLNSTVLRKPKCQIPILSGHKPQSLA